MSDLRTALERRTPSTGHVFDGWVPPEVKARIEAAALAATPVPERCCNEPEDAGVHDTVDTCEAVRGPCLDPRRHHPFRATPETGLQEALELCHAELRDRERKAGKIIASDVALFAWATLSGQRMEPGLAARIRARLASSEGSETHE